MDAGDAGRCLAPVPTAALIDAGLLAPSAGGRLRAPLRVVPFRGVLVAHDRDDGRPRVDHVLGIGGATRSLAALTVDRAGGRLLDVGTGSGAQALHAAHRGRHVVATDLNRRAIRLTRINARLNGLEDRIDARAGNLYEPVRDERFEVVVSNPPFVVSPDRSFTFRDGGRPGDAMSRATVRGAADHLTDGGFATVLVNWIVGEDTDPSTVASAPRAWVDALGCDALILFHEAVDALTYATRWIVQPGPRSRDSFEKMLDRWLEYDRDIGASAVASGAIVLRRRSGVNWTHVETMVDGPTGDGGAQLGRMFDAHGRFKREDDGIVGAIGATAFRLVNGHRLRQHLVFERGAYRPHAATLRLVDTAGVEARIPPDALEALFAIDGARPLRDIVAGLAEARDEDVRAVAQRVVPAVRAAFEAGYLTIAERAS